MNNRHTAQLERIARAVDAFPGVDGARIEADGRLVLDTRVGRREFRTVLQHRLTAARLPLVTKLAHDPTDRRAAIVCADRIDDRLGDALRNAHVQYLDAGGNAWIDADGFHVWVAGRKPVAAHAPPQRLTATALRVLLLALRGRGLVDLTHRDIAAAAGIALGAVGRALDVLIERRLLRRRGDRLELVDPRAALHTFAAGWVEALLPKLAPRRWRTIDPTPIAAERFDTFAKEAERLGYLIGGELAAAQQTEFLETPFATLHVAPGTERDVARALRLVPVDDGPIRTVHRFGGGATFDAGRAPLAQAALVFAELLATPDERVGRTARVFEERWLAGDFG